MVDSWLKMSQDVCLHRRLGAGIYVTEEHTMKRALIALVFAAFTATSVYAYACEGHDTEANMTPAPKQAPKKADPKKADAKKKSDDKKTS